jgi:hypothetical protein
MHHTIHLRIVDYILKSLFVTFCLLAAKVVRPN